MEIGPLRRTVPLLAIAACWRGAGPPPPHGAARPPAPAARESSWRGSCDDPDSSGWAVSIEVSLLLRDDGRELLATGTLGFVGRRARARLRGPHGRGPRHKLTGEMTEISGLGTRWGLVLEVEPGEASIRGRFIELLEEGGEKEMCTFEWSRER
jgi:hypothetical protein